MADPQKLADGIKAVQKSETIVDAISIASKQTSTIKDLVAELGKPAADLSYLGDKVEKALLWRKNAKTAEEIRQADINLELITKEIPATIEARVAKKELVKKIASTIKFGIDVATIVLRK